MEETSYSDFEDYQWDEPSVFTDTADQRTEMAKDGDRLALFDTADDEQFIESDTTADDLGITQR